MWSLILVSIRADSNPFAWDEGSVTRISSDLQRIVRPSDEIAVAHDSRHHRRGTVVTCISFERSGAMVGVPSWVSVSLVTLLRRTRSCEGVRTSLWVVH